jgi:transcriptional regulator with XRE-family HTH domain
MLSTTLESGLRAYKIGPTLRALRLKKSMGLVQLGNHTGLSPAMLSKIERGQLFPTLPTLLRIAMVFSVGLEFFFSAPKEKPTLTVVRAKDRLRLTEHLGGTEPAFEFEALDYTASERRFNAYYGVFSAIELEKLKTHTHAGGEFIYILQGTLIMHINDEDYVLTSGDSMYFDSSIEHGYRRGRGRSCHAIVISS